MTAPLRGIFAVMRGGHKRHAVRLCLRQHHARRARHDALTPKFPPQGIPEVVRAVPFPNGLTNGQIIRLQTDRVTVTDWVSVECLILFPEQCFSLRLCLQGKPRQKFVYLPICIKREQRGNIAFGKSPQKQIAFCEHRCVLARVHTASPVRTNRHTLSTWLVRGKRSAAASRRTV